MALWFFAILLLGDDFHSISLNAGHDILVEDKIAKVQFDGSVLIPGEKRMYHFSKDGGLIRIFRSPKSGNDSFESFTTFVWTGDKYVLFEPLQGFIKVYDKNGTFMRQNDLYVRGLYWLDGTLYGQDLEPYSKDDRQGKPLYVLNLDGNGAISKTERAFYFINPDVFDFRLNMKECFMVKKADQFFVMDVLGRDVTVYDQSYERKRTFDAELRHYVSREKPWTRGLPWKELIANMAGMSRVLNLFATHDGLAVQFTVPDKTATPDGFRLATQVVDHQGGFLRKVSMPGTVIGTHQGKLYALEEKAELNYVLHIEK